MRQTFFLDKVIKNYNNIRTRIESCVLSTSSKVYVINSSLDDITLSGVDYEQEDYFPCKRNI